MTTAEVERIERSQLLTDFDWVESDQPDQKDWDQLPKSNLPVGLRSIHAKLGDFLFVLSGLPPKWLNPTWNQISELSKLKQNWDSYGAKSISQQRAIAAIKVLQRILRRETPAPAVVPTVRGNLQFEWHQDEIDLEIEVYSTTKVHLYFEDQVNGESREEIISGDLSRVFAFVNRLIPAE